VPSAEVHDGAVPAVVRRLQSRLQRHRRELRRMGKGAWCPCSDDADTRRESVCAGRREASSSDRTFPGAAANAPLHSPIACRRGSARRTPTPCCACAPRAAGCAPPSART
jgi:hypothetical protein